jgi:hypothetical protein
MGSKACDNRLQKECRATLKVRTAGASGQPPTHLFGDSGHRSGLLAGWLGGPAMQLISLPNGGALLTRCCCAAPLPAARRDAGAARAAAPDHPPAPPCGQLQHAFYSLQQQQGLVELQPVWWGRSRISQRSNSRSMHTQRRRRSSRHWTSLASTLQQMPPPCVNPCQWWHWQQWPLSSYSTTGGQPSGTVQGHFTAGMPCVFCGECNGQPARLGLALTWHAPSDTRLPACLPAAG